MTTITTVRFNELTWNENYRYRLKHECCIYGSPQQISCKIAYESILFVVEMNNDTNKIKGIGLIRNRPLLDNYYKLYTEGNYNRYIYKSNYHIDRETLITHNHELVEILDYILFKEKTHLKRGCGFLTVPYKLLNHIRCSQVDIKSEIKQIFIRVFNENCLNT